MRTTGDPKRRTWLWVALCVAARASLAVADVAVPPPPEHYFNDQANFVAEDVARRLDETLRRFDEETSSQVVVAVFPKLPSPSLEDFTARTAQAWRVGRKDLDNGAVLFVFAQDRKLRLEVGYGLEDRIPDAVAKRIIEDVIVPRFRSGDPAGGLSAGVDAILAAARGKEMPAQPPPRAASERRETPLFGLVTFAIFLTLASLLGRAPQSATYSRRGHRQASGLSGGGCISVAGILGGLAAFLMLSGSGLGGGSLVIVVLVLVALAVLLSAGHRGGGAGWGGGWPSGGWGGSWGGGGWSSGGWGGGSSGGGFSGGGGSFGGGGASGSW